MKELDTLKVIIDQKLNLIQHEGFLNTATASLLFKEFNKPSVKFLADECTSIIGRRIFAPGELPENSLLDENKEYYYTEFRFRITGPETILKCMTSLPLFKENNIFLIHEIEETYFSYCYYAENDFLGDEKTLIRIEESALHRKVILFENIIMYNIKINEMNNALRDYIDHAIFLSLINRRKNRSA